MAKVMMVKQSRKREDLAISIILLLLVLLLALLGFKVSLVVQPYIIGNTSYDNLQESFRSVSTETIVDAVQENAKVPQVEIPQMQIDYEALAALNEEAIAWLYCPDTMIDYPVLSAENYDYYLTHLPDGTVNSNGSLFLDYHFRDDFSEEFSIIYGHHMKSGAMFGNLTKYKKQSYYEEHPYVYLYTKDGNYRVELVYGVVIPVDTWQQDYINTKDLAGLLEYGKENTTFQSSVVPQEGDRFLVLSTCSYEYQNARFIVIGRLVAEYD